MLYFMITQAHRYTLLTYLKGRGAVLFDTVRVRTYEDRNLRFRRGTYLFSDLERLTDWQRRRAGRLCRHLEAVGCVTLNSPLHSLVRYELLRTLRARGQIAFNVFRPEENLSGVRFPVFLHSESDHTGSLTEPLHTEDQLESALRDHPDSLITEFLDTADHLGIYRKYSAFRIGEHIIPRHLFFSRHWMIKQADLTGPDQIDEELEYVRVNPHREQLLKIFQLAGLEYGRIDYGLQGDKLQVWEINTNPSIAGPDSLLHPEREAVHRLFADRFNSLLADMSATGPSGGRLIVHPNMWRKPPWVS